MDPGVDRLARPGQQPGLPRRQGLGDGQRQHDLPGRAGRRSPPTPAKKMLIENMDHANWPSGPAGRFGNYNINLWAGFASSTEPRGPVRSCAPGYDQKFLPEVDQGRAVLLHPDVLGFENGRRLAGRPQAQDLPRAEQAEPPRRLCGPAHAGRGRGRQQVRPRGHVRQGGDRPDEARQKRSSGRRTSTSRSPEAPGIARESGWHAPRARARGPRSGLIEWRVPRSVAGSTRSRRSPVCWWRRSCSCSSALVAYPFFRRRLATPCQTGPWPSRAASSD